MSITRTAAAWTAGSTSVTPPLPASPQAGDLHVIYIGGKPYSITIQTLLGWTLITGTDGQNGTVASGTDVGSVRWAAFYRYWQSGDDETPTWTITGGNVVLAVAVRFRPTAGSTINTPVGCKGWDNTSGTGYSAATVLTLKYRKPDGTVGSWTAAPSGTTAAKYVTTAVADLNLSGSWDFQLYVELAGWKGHADLKSAVIQPHL